VVDKKFEIVFDLVLDPFEPLEWLELVIVLVSVAEDILLIDSVFKCLDVVKLRSSEELYLDALTNVDSVVLTPLSLEIVSIPYVVVGMLLLADPVESLLLIFDLEIVVLSDDVVGLLLLADFVVIIPSIIVLIVERILDDGL
jgi:hypothetical protein